MTETSGRKTVHLTLPLETKDLVGLEIGTVVYLTGRVFTAREGVYKRAVEDGMGLPAAPAEMGIANFHCSPAATINSDGSASGLTKGTSEPRHIVPLQNQHMLANQLSRCVLIRKRDADPLLPLLI